MTPEELDEARGKETLRRLINSGQVYCHEDIAALGARLAREGWTPPEPVDRDVLAYREWAVGSAPNQAWREEVLAGKWDRSVTALGFVAGAAASAKRIKELEEGLSMLYDLFTYVKPFAFRNGITDSTDTIDEGEVKAGLILDHAKALLKEPDQ